MNTARLWVYRLLTALLPETRFFEFKSWLLRWCGARIGKNVRISSSASFYGGGKLVIGDDVWIGSGCFIHPVLKASIRIGNSCDLGPEVMILTGSHEIDVSGEHIAGKGTAADVGIGDGSWLGARTTILSGVLLPRKTLVAAGSTVTTSFSEEQLLLAGVPAKLKRRIV